MHANIIAPPAFLYVEGVGPFFFFSSLRTYTYGVLNIHAFLQRISSVHRTEICIKIAAGGGGGGPQSELHVCLYVHVHALSLVTTHIMYVGRGGMIGLNIMAKIICPICICSIPWDYLRIPLPKIPSFWYWSGFAFCTVQYIPTPNTASPLQNRPWMPCIFIFHLFIPSVSCIVLYNTIVIWAPWYFFFFLFMFFFFFLPFTSFLLATVLSHKILQDVLLWPGSRIQTRS